MFNDGERGLDMGNIDVRFVDDEAEQSQRHLFGKILLAILSVLVAFAIAEWYITRYMVPNTPGAIHVSQEAQ